MCFCKLNAHANTPSVCMLLTLDKVSQTRHIQWMCNNDHWPFKNIAVIFINKLSYCIHSLHIIVIIVFISSFFSLHFCQRNCYESYNGIYATRIEFFILNKYISLIFRNHLKIEPFMFRIPSIPFALSSIHCTLHMNMCVPIDVENSCICS